MKILMILIALLPGIVLAEECSPIDSKASFVQFDIEQAGTPFNGRLEQVSGEVCREGESVSRVHAEVAASSVATGLPELDAALKDEYFFDVNQYPTLQFSSDRISQEDGRWVADGTLTIKGKSKAMRLPFDMEEDASAPQATGEIAIRRLDFGIGTGEWENTEWLADIVRVKFVVQENAQ